MNKIMIKPNEWISVAYREGVWIGRREADNWVWKQATEEEIKSFNFTGDVQETEQ